MKLHEEFQVSKPVAAVWTFFEEPESVARCLPGVEAVEVLDADNLSVRATQSIGPMTATFETKVTVLDRVPNELIRFQATGRTVRGAIGNVRTMNSVRLREVNGSTMVDVEADLILAGALGSVGQKAVARQASKVTEEFAANLRRALTGEFPVGADTLANAPSGPATADAASRLPAIPLARSGQSDPWGKAAAVLSAVSVVLSGIALARSRQGTR
jgi:uncharacterized protein